MDIQSTLTQAIEFIVMSFVALMIFDFIDGLYVVPLPPIAIAPSNASSKSTVTATQFQPLIAIFETRSLFCHFKNSKQCKAHCALVVALRYAPDTLEFAHARQHLEIAIALSGEYHKL